MARAQRALQNEKPQNPQTLFREEAVLHSMRRMPGSLIVNTPANLKIFSVLFCMVGLLAAVFFLFSEFTKKEQVKGVVQPDHGLVKVFSGVTGTVTDFNVAVGEHVIANQKLADVQSDLSIVGGATAIQQQLLAARQHLIELSGQVDSERARADIAVRKLQTKRASLEDQIVGYNNSLGIQKRIFENLQQEVLIGKKMAEQKLLPLPELSRREIAERSSEIEIAKLDREKRSADTERQATLTDIEVSPKELALSISRLDVEKNKVDQQILSLEAQLHYNLVAPISGTVDFIAAQSGQHIAANTQVISIVPDGSQMVVELFVPAGGIPSIKEQQQVRISYDAFPAIRFGYANATIVNINQTILDPNEARTYGAIVTEPVYRILTKLEKQIFKAIDKDVPLRAGMSLTADVIVEKHTLWQWIAGYLTEGWHAR